MSSFAQQEDRVKQARAPLPLYSCRECSEHIDRKDAFPPCELVWAWGGHDPHEDAPFPHDWYCMRCCEEHGLEEGEDLVRFMARAGTDRPAGGYPREPGWDWVPPRLPKERTDDPKGWLCGQCGARHEYGLLYGWSCLDQDCPVGGTNSMEEVVP